MENIMVNKKEFIKEVAEKLGKTQKETAEIYEAMVGTICEHLEKGEAVKLSGFVTFDIQEVEERTARNPRTGEAVPVPAHNRVKVKISKTLKDLVH